MKYGLVKHLAIGLLGIGLLSACGTPPVVPEDAFYRITPDIDNTGEDVLAGVVEVGRFAAFGSLGNRPLLLSRPGSNAVTEYNYHFWIESPPILLQTALVSYLRLARVADRVVTPEMRAIPDYVITGHVLRLETVRGAEPKGVVTFELALRREKDGKLIVLDEYVAEIPAAQDRVQDGALALEKAVNAAFASFVADIRTAVK